MDFFNGKGNTLFSCDCCDRLNTGWEGGVFPICECGEPAGPLNKITIEHVQKMRELLHDFATSGVSLEDPRLRYVEIQASPEAIREARKLLGLEP